MTVPVPQPLPSTSGWQLVDWLDATYTSPPAAGGTAQIQLPQLETNVRWQLTHMVASCSSTATTSMRLYLDSVAAGTLRDGTAAGNFDVADWPAGLLVPPSRTLLAVWSGASDGAIASLTLQANVYRLAGT